MLAKHLRKWFGSVRLAMTLMAFVVGVLVVVVDVFTAFTGTNQLYGYLASLAGVVAVFVWKDTDRPTGYFPQASGFQYKGEEGDA
jgi:hypothetical protein